MVVRMRRLQRTTSPRRNVTPEILLLRIAARLDTAIRYKEAHPNGDYSDWADKLG
jgi:hypothetical protein